VSKFNVKLVTKNDWFTIYINNVVHVKIRQTKLMGIQSWVDSVNGYCINVYLTEGPVVSLEYDSANKWLKVLKLFESI
jgi:hypothetical protein